MTPLLIGSLLDRAGNMDESRTRDQPFMEFVIKMVYTQPVVHISDLINFNWDDISRKSSCKENGVDQEYLSVKVYTGQYLQKKITESFSKFYCLLLVKCSKASWFRTSLYITLHLLNISGKLKTIELPTTHSELGGGKIKVCKLSQFKAYHR